MQLTETKLKEIFNEWNEKAFEGKLPTPNFKLTTTKRILGSYTLSKRLISISVFYDHTENEFVNTIVHEMLHYYIHYFRIKDTSVHGRVWKRMANDLNKRFPELSIARCGTCSHVVNKSLLEGKRSTKKRIVFIGKGKDGNYYASIIPKKNLNHFRKVYTNWSFLSNIHFIEHYDNEVMLTLPTVRTRGAIKRISKESFDDFLNTRESEFLFLKGT